MIVSLDADYFSVTLYTVFIVTKVRYIVIWVISSSDGQFFAGNTDVYIFFLLQPIRYRFVTAIQPNIFFRYLFDQIWLNKNSDEEILPYENKHFKV